MSFQLTEPIIKLLCGHVSYEIGMDYYRNKRIEFTNYNTEASIFEATIAGEGSAMSNTVTVEMDRQGDINAGCTCPSFQAYDNYCKHIAAVLLNIQELQKGDHNPTRVYPSLLHPEDRPSEQGRLMSAHTSGNPELSNQMLGLFSQKPPRSSRMKVNALFDTRVPLEVQFLIKLFPYRFNKCMFGIELKLGTKRIYIVQRLRELLERMELREPYVFSKHFTFDPQLHRFQAEDDAILEQLIQIHHTEKLFRETSSSYTVNANSLSGDRMLLIPPTAWAALQPLLTASSSVQLEQDGILSHGIHLSNEVLPLQFEFNQSPVTGYYLDVQGLDDITVMDEYGLALAGGKLIPMPAEQSKRLSELKHMLDDTHKHQVPIPQEQVEPFMEKVIPGLMKLGGVTISQAVSERMIHTTLKAKLYLDRVKDRLLASLEFQYGDIVINPLDAFGPGQHRGEGLILMRDGEQEQRILELMDQGSFAKTESGYFMTDEEAEYDFLYHIVPLLEPLVDIYATSAIKVRLHAGHAAPKVTVSADERTEWMDFTFQMEGIPEDEIRLVLKSLEERRKYYRLASGALLPLESAEFQEIGQFMSTLAIRKGDWQGTDIRLPLVRGLHLIDAEHQGKAVKLGKSLRQLVDHMRNPDHLDFPVPVHLAPVLRDYQKFGYQWLKTLAHYRFGGILADDMGLGKTLQSIAFLVSVLPEIRDQQLPAIIISPASLVYNWLNELKKFAPDIRAIIADGSKAERSLTLKGSSQVDVIITSYPLLRRDIEQYVQQSFHTLILDEAQMFKNHATQTAQAVREIQARYRFALTGTPIENSLEELWSIFDSVFPELFTSRRAFLELSRDAVAKRIRPFLLRRLKTDVLKELPEKIESLQASELLPEQKKLYVAYLAKLRHETVKHLNAETFQKNRIKILAGLTRLRQLCCHPALFVEEYTGGSAKFEQLMEIIEECRSSGKRMLVFSQFTGMLDLIGRELGYQGVPYFYLDGKTPAQERVELCDRFNKGARDLFLISLKAGGTGLNLTGADTVILYDLWWNPAVEQQAADRAHRFGQKNVVQVIRLVAQGTVEDKMYELQQRKKNLIEEVIQPGEESLSTLSEQEIREILMLDSE